MREVIIPVSISMVYLLIYIPFQQITCSSSQLNDKPFDLEEKRLSNTLDDCSNSTCSSLPHFLKNIVPNPKLSKIKADLIQDVAVGCPSNLTCSELPSDCIICVYNYSCTYGSSVILDCKPRSDAIKCGGSRFFPRNMTCQYCYQMPEQNYVCSGMAGCNARTAPRQFYRANCTAHSHILCLGYRQFSRNLPCNWTSGYKWSTALVLSITLGGFGADRFYLGHWQEGIGKLFSFGGLGVWTLIDVVLIAIGYLGPADGSLYV